MKRFRNIEQIIPVYCAFNNTVDKDIQLMLWPLNLLQFISFTPKYRIKNNHITPNSLISNLFSMIGVVIFISLYIFRSSMLVLYNYFWFTKFMCVTPFIDCVYYTFGFAMNFGIGVIQSKNNIKFILVFQRVHRFLNNETSFNQFITWNWISVILALGSYFFFFSYFNMQLSLPWFYLCVHCLLIVFDLNILYADRLMKLLVNKLELWNDLVINSLEIEGARDEDFNRRMFQAYVDIMECYGMLKVCFQSFILYYIVEVFLHSLIHIEVTIETLKVGARNNNMRGPALGLQSLLVWLSKNLMWQTMFMQRCETFYLAVENVRDSCALILKSNCSDYEKKLCKNVLRLQRASFSKLRVCGLFYVGAALQLCLLCLLANYTVVLLQFAIL